MKIFTIFSLVALFSTPFIGFSEESIEKSTNDFTKPIVIYPDQNTLSLNISSNLSTGYSWYITKTDNQFFSLSSHEYASEKNTSNKDDWAGVPETETFTFNINPEFHKAPYLGEIDFAYLRAWDLSLGIHKILWIASVPGTPAQVQTPTATSPTSRSETPAASATSSTTNTTWLSI